MPTTLSTISTDSSSRAHRERTKYTNIIGVEYRAFRVRDAVLRDNARVNLVGARRRVRHANSVPQANTKQMIYSQNRSC
jgi:hypothetical protein